MPQPPIPVPSQVHAPARPPTRTFTAFLEYPVADESAVARLGRDVNVDARVRRVTEEITAIEGPVLIDRLTRLTYGCFGVRHTTPSHKANLYIVLPNAKLIREPGGLYLWPDHLDPSSWREFRRTANPADRRPAEITIDEMTSAVVHVLSLYPNGIDQDLLIRAALRALGHSQSAEKTHSRMVLATERAVREHRAKRRGMTFHPLHLAVA